jgi:hypothetical protein
VGLTAAGTALRLRSALSLAVLLCIAAVGAQAETPAMTLDVLMSRFAASRGVEAQFVESKELALLVEPLKSQGRIYFVPPHRLARHVHAPLASQLSVDGDALTLRSESGVDHIDLGASEVARHFVEGFIVLFSGNLPELKRRYRVAFQAEGDAWQMQLEPRQRVVRHMIETIALRGQGLALEEMRVIETQGDRTTTRFESIQSDRLFSEDEVSRLFDANHAGTGALAPSE